MAGGAAGGFLTRAFDSMLKECSNRKYPELQKAIQNYTDITKEASQSKQSEANQPAPSPESGSANETEDGAATRTEADQSQKALSGNITVALANAGHTLEGADAELVLNPLRLAFETKNLKILEPALDCLHKLIAYDHLEGDPGLDGGKNVPLFTDILNMVCNCIDNSSPDSTILQVLKVLLTAVASSKFRVHGEPLLGVIRVCYNIALNSKSPINQATSKAMLTQMISIIFRRMETDPVETSSGSGGHTIAEAASAENLNTKSDETSVGESNEKDLTLGDALSQAKDASPTSLEELQNLAGGADIKGLEAVLDKAVHTEDGKKITRGIDLESMSIVQRDALLVFRTLCKMGMKEDNDEVTTKTRILSLELLQGLLEGVSHSFTKNFHFIDSVKAYLSYALLRASVSQSPVIFQYATGIFLVLLLRFRESLKGEIGIFFPLIVLRPLDGLEFPVNQKLSVLRMLEKVCKDPQMLVDIFVNYDCDLEAPNLFERMVTTLSKIAQGTQNTDPNSVAVSQAASIKGSSLQGLVSVLKSLVDWEQSHRELEKLKNNQQEGVSAEDSFEVRSREDVTSDFEKAKAHKSTLEAAIAEFNRKPMKGVEYLISNKLVENTPASVAQFLKNTPNLNKATIGDYLGQHEEFPLAVMHAYVDSMKFSGMKFDTAIREFLKGFRLPGEAQKIDRIMEKFAERYCADNPGLFKNADTAYVLAYAVIMLNTDAHNPMVWPKMSKSDFVRMNARDDPDECAPRELLEEIYDSIVKEEIKMKDDTPFIGKSSRQKPEGEEGRLVSILNLALPKRKSSGDAKSESEAIIKKTQAIFRNQGVKRGVFYTAQQIELVRPMVDAVGWPLLATFSVTMEEGENKPRVVLLMEGFKAGIHITYVLGMDTMRYAFLTSLVRFTFLHAPKEMRSKNVEALRTLLVLCDSDMNALQDTWNAVLECVSRLEFITTTPAISATVMHGSNQISKDAVVQSLKELAGKPAEQVFMNSVKLPSDSVVEFFTALCGVSAEELKQTPARVFSLQKLVEISYYNMARIRMVWARIWSVLANHFISAGSHHDEKIAMYAIDSLRQLGMKYLERSELANFTFQNDILKPFVVLMRNSQSESKRRLIVDCIVQMIKSKVGSIKSGWRSVFMIFTAAADDELESIVESAFENVEQVILEHFDQVVGDCFMDCVNCLIRFANNKTSHRISLKAIALLRICEDRLAEGLIPGGALMPIDANLDATLDVTEHYWFPMLAGLSDLTSDQRPEVRSCALEVLFDLLNERGSKFSAPFWESIFHRVLFPIFDHVRHAGKESFVSTDDDWFRETSIHSLQLLCNLFNTFYKEVCFMLPPLLSLLLDCAKKTDQTVVSISLGALVHLIQVGGHQFSETDWDTLLKSIRDASYTTQPLELLNALSVENLRNHGGIIRDSEANAGDSVTIKSADNEVVGDHQLDVNSNGKLSPLASSNANADGVEDSVSQINVDQSEGLPSPSGRTPKAADGGGLQRSQTLGQRIMGNMMENIFLRNLTSKSKSRASDASQPSSPIKVADTVEPDTKNEESPLLVTVRGKCITQLLLLGAIDGIQKKYWTKLKAPQKIAVMDILLSLLEFAASYNSSTNLRTRMHQIPDERPPINLLRQELSGTGIYLDILQKSTYGFETNKEKRPESDGFQDADSTADNNDLSITQHSDAEEKFERVAEEKLVSFCEQVLRDASDLQSSTGETTNMDIHRVLELRAPIIVKVLQSMCFMNNKIFRRHLREFYPLLTKLVCCDQLHIHGVFGTEGTQNRGKSRQGKKTHDMGLQHFTTCFLLALCILSQSLAKGALGFACNWGTRSSHHLPPQITVKLMKDNGINKVKLFEAEPWALKALGNSGIQVMVGIPNDLLESIANNVNAAIAWVNQNVSTYISKNGVDIRYVAVGNEAFLKTYNGRFVQSTFPAIKNIQAALIKAGLGRQVKVTTPLNADVYQSDSGLPSGGNFRPDIQDQMISIIKFLSQNGGPLTFNIYPFLSLDADPNFPKEFAFFDGSAAPVVDGPITYTNVFDANFDTLISALEKNGFGSMPVIIGEVGWPTDGTANANIKNAQRFNQGLVDRIIKKQGTPKRPAPPEIYMFGLLDEDTKSIEPGAFERHWGIFNFDGSMKYPLNLGGGKSLVGAKGVRYLSKQWCVMSAQANVLDPSFADSMSKACTYADCTCLAPGSSCSGLDTKGNASYAFNMYYQTMDQRKDACQFNGLSVITNIDPSPPQSACKFKIMIDLGKHENKSTSSAVPRSEINSMVVLVSSFIFTIMLSLCI